MKNEIDIDHKSGFWGRFTAMWIDLFIVFIAVKLIVFMFRNANIYVPLELIFVLSFFTYSIVLTCTKGSTIGKVLCGLTVRSLANTKVGCFRAILRETIGKVVSAIPLFSGFMWIGFTRKKRGFHDYVAGTTVIQNVGSQKQTLRAMGIVLALVMVLFGTKAAQIIMFYSDIRQVALPSEVTMPYTSRDPSSLVEISSLSEKNYSEFIKWLDTYAQDPVEYALKTAATHQVTIFGEAHEQQDCVLFLNKIIPELYHRAGVRCVAMEVCLAEDNEKISQLVTAPEFDRDLALQLARHQSWGIWGFKEYWDVFETVWRLNKGIPNGQPKMRLIGIDAKFDGPSLGLVAGGEGAKIKSPLWEKLRIFRLFDDFVLLAKRDELMARNIEKEIIQRGDRGIVWIGLNHSYTDYQQPIVVNGKLVRKWNRMGVILHQKYGEKVFQVALHELSYFDPIMGDVIEPMMDKLGRKPVGFDVSDSPFADLRDSNSQWYRYQPTVRFADRACGYIYLKPCKEMKKCEWLSGYVSDEMFLANKPYYQAWAGLVDRKVNNANEADEALKVLMIQP